MNTKKTPVSILHEMMVKNGITPNYELLHNGGGTHQGSFIYKVSCAGFTATGSGRCKKDAKHEAASLMLETIATHNALPQLPATPCESPVRTPIPLTLPVCPKSPANIPFRNAIGELQNLCINHNLEDPVYQVTGDIGPPHARIFSVQCRLSTFTEEGTATTKKQAKHEAARRMIERIMDVVSDMSTCMINNEHLKKEHVASKIAMAKYPELCDNFNNEMTRSRINWGLKISNFHQMFKERFDEDDQKALLVKLQHLLTLINDSHDLSEEDLMQFIKEFECAVESVDIQISHHTLKGNDDSLHIYSIQLNSAPDINEIGTSTTEIEAKVCALSNVIKTMILFLK